MAWLAVDKGGIECIYSAEPNKYNENDPMWQTGGNFIYLPKGSIEKLTGKKLTWNDEPIKI